MSYERYMISILKNSNFREVRAELIMYAVVYEGGGGGGGRDGGQERGSVHHPLKDPSKK